MKTDSKEFFYKIMQGEVDGNMLIASVLSELQEEDEREALPWFLSIETEFSLEKENSEEQMALEEWQELLEREIGKVPFIYFGRVTLNGRREIIYYIAEPEAVVQSLEKLIDNESTRPFAFFCEMDEDWGNVMVYFHE